MSNTDFQTAAKQEEAYLRAVHPTPEDIPGCMKLFDDFLACNIMGVQLKSLYRYGHMSVCDHKLDDFKFCMSIKNMHPEEKRDAWIHRRAEWWARRRLERSSEDVWDIRTEPLKDFPPARPDVTSSSTSTIE
ncbi:hypothetical protein POSPLADRAFT_1140715 [Postia placenta MAD-698-R-SB12]|uniref:Early meiotic induction protein 1 n=1 Tax=Postia placenta MAD-698-R-SB12 TaxID=670580 RepID=A0A1X6N267_9APHY|nr:hypothetical protein POSPLADRAFT_1140715 [Postia placenta MAD-698-R-SB12]OSX62715.1 hypothetical protein POSPLADRAFT_1140715 [Postia placenta MAD-698-R-SB12]